jgi:PPK2 family polyphosphate:nucleotide phosphotransferase
MPDPDPPARIDCDRHRAAPGDPVDLADWPTRVRPDLSRDQGRALLKRLTRRLDELQEVLYAQSEHAMLVVMQAMDAGGKDSTIRKVFGPLNPQGVRVAGFKAPTPIELAHDFLWRIHARTPRRGMIRVFNRSHYEDVLIARVKRLVDERRWRRRYDHIIAFERMLADEGTSIVKFFLHISSDYQKRRFERRLDRPDKHWKFNPGDLKDRARWDDYQQAYAEAIGRTTTDHAPWYIVPAERKWYRCLVVAQALVDRLESLDLAYPEPTFDPSDIRIE